MKILTVKPRTPSSQLNSKEKEEVEFWLDYISNYEAKHNEPIPEKAQLLLENALIKLECYQKSIRRNQLYQSNDHTFH